MYCKLDVIQKRKEFQSVQDAFGEDSEECREATGVLNAILSALTIFFLYLTIVFFAKRLIKKKGEEYSLPESIAIFGSGAVGALAYCFYEGQVWEAAMFTAAKKLTNLMPTVGLSSLPS